MLGIANAFTSTYYPQTNGQTERSNRTIIQMFRCYVADHQRDWDTYFQALTFAYNMAVHCSTGMPALDLVLSHPPADFAVQGESHHVSTNIQDQLREMTPRFEKALTQARESLAMAQARYIWDFDKRVRPANAALSAGDFVYIDPTEGGSKISETRTSVPSNSSHPRHVHSSSNGDPWSTSSTVTGSPWLLHPTHSPRKTHPTKRRSSQRISTGNPGWLTASRATTNRRMASWSSSSNGMDRTPQLGIPAATYRKNS